MFKVKNKKCIHRLSVGTFKLNKMQNVFAVIAIVLTTILFTSLFTSFAIIEKSIEDNTMRATGGSAHGTYKNITSEQYEIISQNKRIKQISYSIFLAFAENDELKKHDSEITYVNSNEEAEARFSLPTEGRLPEKSNEIATDTIVLDLLGVPARLGENVEIIYSIGDNIHTDTFTLVGFWEGDSVAPTSQIFISKDYLNQALIGSGGYDENAGKINADVFFKNSIGIKSKMQKVLDECGYGKDEIEFGVNQAYVGNFESFDVKTMVVAVAAMFLIMLCGYLMISNVFYISITKDIRYYGLLKSIGTTSKQIKSIIHSYGAYICLIGVPLGLIAGYAVSKGLIPSLLNILSFDSFDITFNPFIFIISAVFAVMTVFISSSKATRRASKISPIEAVKISDNENGKFLSIHKKHFGLFDMAFFNVMRNRRKAALVVFSLTLSLILLNATYSSVSSFSLEKYVGQMISHDFAVASNTYFSNRYDGSGLDEELISSISAQEGVKSLEKVYSYEIAEPYVLSDGTSADVILYGIDDKLLDLLTITQGENDLRENKVFVNVKEYGNDTNSGSESYFRVGDKISLNVADKKFDLDISALGELPYNLSRRYGYSTTLEIIMSSENYISITSDNEPMLAVFNVDEGNLSRMETFLSTTTSDTDYQYESKSDLKTEFESMKKTISLMGYTLSVIVGFLGISNFLNTIITSIMSRKREIAVLQSLGMTRKQTRRLLSFEGLIYLFAAFVFSVTVGSLIGYLGVSALLGESGYLDLHFSVLPTFICLPILMILSVVIPNIVQRIVSRQSLVDRLKEWE